MTARSTPPPYIAVGRINGPFGIRGELKVDILTDFPSRFDPGSRLFLAEEPVTVADARVSGINRLVVRLEEVQSRTQAEAIPRGATLDILEGDVTPLPDGAYYRFQLIGLQAVTNPDRASIGTVEDVLETGVNDVLIIRAPGRPETLVPNTQEIATVDLENGVVLVEPVEGLLPPEEPEKRQEQPGPPRRGRRRRRRPPTPG